MGLDIEYALWYTIENKGKVLGLTQRGPKVRIR